MTTWYRTEIEAAAASHQLDPNVVEAVVVQESSGRTDAFRFEPGFWDRYLKDNPAWRDKNPRRVSSSYGLLQIMYVTASELGFSGEPELLFLPQVGLDWGCKKLADCLAWAARVGPGADDETRLRSALASYNGGRTGNFPDDLPDRNAAYADSVLKRLDDLA